MGLVKYCTFVEKTMTVQSNGMSGLFGRRSGGMKRTSNTEKQTQAKIGETASTTTGGSLDQEPVVVWEAANNMEAQIVKGRLESEGIPAIIRGEALGPIIGLTAGGLAATDVLVPAPLAEKALEILHTEVIWEETDKTDKEAGKDSNGTD
jgi:hypothetical protein